MPITRARIYGRPKRKTGDLRKVHRKSAWPGFSCRPERVCKGPVAAVTNDHQRRPLGVGRLKQQKCMFSPSGGPKSEVTVLTAAVPPRTTGRLRGGGSFLPVPLLPAQGVRVPDLPPLQERQRGFQARPQSSSPDAQLDPPAQTPASKYRFRGRTWACLHGGTQVTAPQAGACVHPTDTDRALLCARLCSRPWGSGQQSAMA